MRSDVVVIDLVAHDDRTLELSSLAVLCIMAWILSWPWSLALERRAIVTILVATSIFYDRYKSTSL